MSEYTSDQTETAAEGSGAGKPSRKGGTMVIIAVVVALALLIAFNMN
jgi:hypothetical protein